MDPLHARIIQRLGGVLFDKTHDTDMRLRRFFIRRIRWQDTALAPFERAVWWAVDYATVPVMGAALKMMNYRLTE